MRTLSIQISALLISFGLIACGGSENSFTSNGSLSLAITDAAVDEADAVVVSFDSIEIHGGGLNRVFVEFDTPKQIDLLGLQGSSHHDLLIDEPLVAGEYQWIRLGVITENLLDSYIKIGDVYHELTIPSGALVS